MKAILIANENESKLIKEISGILEERNISYEVKCQEDKERHVLMVGPGPGQSVAAMALVNLGRIPHLTVFQPDEGNPSEMKRFCDFFKTDNRFDVVNKGIKHPSGASISTNKKGDPVISNFKRGRK